MARKGALRSLFSKILTTALRGAMGSGRPPVTRFIETLKAQLAFSPTIAQWLKHPSGILQVMGLHTLSDLDLPQVKSIPRVSWQKKRELFQKKGKFLFVSLFMQKK